MLVTICTCTVQNLFWLQKGIYIFVPAKYSSNPPSMLFRQAGANKVKQPYFSGGINGGQNDVRTGGSDSGLT